jgi:hypothetical protein
MQDSFRDERAESVKVVRGWINLLEMNLQSCHVGVNGDSSNRSRCFRLLLEGKLDPSIASRLSLL